MSERDVRGAFGGSRLFEQPAYRAELDAYLAFVAVERPRLMEIGFDHGRRLSRTAALNPGWGIVGLEIRKRRVLEAEERRAAAGHDHLLPWRADARTVLARHTPEACFDVIEALFPDPWWNEAHRAKRLLVEPAFLDDVARALKPGGVVLLATDVEDYGRHMASLVAAHEGLHAVPFEASLRPPCDALSRREWRCERDGLTVYRVAAVV